MSERLTVGSLFSGIGGFDLAFERAGMEVKWQCEIDLFCRHVLKKHWPDTQVYTDVKEMNATNTDRVDVICGGFPCQDLSVAGKGAGLDGERSGLWWEYARLVGELRPRYVVIENVPALKTRGLNAVLGSLAESGYDAEWQCLPASAFGAPHQRDRIWIVAYTNGDDLWEQQRRSRRTNGSGARVARVDGEAQQVANATSARLQRRAESKAARRAQSESAARGSGSRTSDTDTDCSGLTEHTQRDCESETGQQGASGNDAERLRAEVSYPDGSGRDGRPRASESQAGSGQPPHSDWWESEPDLGRGLDGFSSWLDSALAPDSHMLVLAYGKTSGRTANQALRAMRSGDAAQEVWDKAGRRLGLSSQEILLTYMCKLAERSEAGNVSLEGEEVSEEYMRGLWAEYKSTSTSLRSKPSKQPPREPADALQALSRLLAFRAEEAWLAYRRSDAGAGLAWEAGISRVADGLPNRVDRTKSLGNALVPQIAQWIAEKIVEREGVNDICR